MAERRAVVHLARRRTRLRSPAIFSVIAACALVLVSIAYLRTALTYDEAVYLQLARVIAQHGLPMRREYQDFSQFRLFENSPPCVLYVAALSQLLLPGNDVAARAIHIAVFAVPTYAVVWWVVLSRFGQWAAFASLASLLASGGYMRATSHVLLDVPLGLLACIALVAFHAASHYPSQRTWYIAIASLGMAVAVWTKYQAICIFVAIVIFAVHAALSREHNSARSLLLPLATVAITAGGAVLALVWFFWTYGGLATLQATLEWNARRLNVSPMVFSQIVGDLVDTLRESVGMLGAAALLSAAFALCTERRCRGLLVLMGIYAAVSVVFNLVVFRFPGAGASYLHAAVPAVAVAAGPGSVRMVQLAGTASSRMLAAAIVAIQLAGSGNADWRYEIPRPNGLRAAANYIAARSSPTSGVLASTVAIEFYTGRPVRAVGFTYPRALILRSLDGTSGDDISFVVTGDGPPTLQNLEPFREQWVRLLAEHFEPVLIAHGICVYRRRTGIATLSHR